MKILRNKKVICGAQKCSKRSGCGHGHFHSPYALCFKEKSTEEKDEVWRGDGEEPCVSSKCIEEIRWYMGVRT